MYKYSPKSPYKFTVMTMPRLFLDYPKFHYMEANICQQKVEILISINPEHGYRWGFILLASVVMIIGTDEDLSTFRHYGNGYTWLRKLFVNGANKTGPQKHFKPVV